MAFPPKPEDLGFHANNFMSKVASRKAKGRRLQYWVAEKVATLLGVTFDQQDDTCPVHSREMGQKGADVYIRDMELAKSFPYSIECKNTETFSIYNVIKQVKANTKEGQEWVIFHKKNHSDPVAIISAEHFFDILKKIS